MQLAEFRCQDFESVINQTEERDFLYADPPYFDTFTDYSKGGFGPAEQERLALALYRAHERGVTFLAHNSMEGSETAGARWWYEDFAKIIPIEEPRRIAANGDRDSATCALITNNEDLARLLTPSL